MRPRLHKFIALLAFLLGGLTFRGEAVTLTWSPSSDGAVAGYYLVWGTNTGLYFATNVYDKTVTSATVTNLDPGEVYYFSIAAFDSNNVLSVFSNEILYTNAASSPDTNYVGTPPPPPPPPSPPDTNDISGGGPPPPPPPQPPGSNNIPDQGFTNTPDTNNLANNTNNTSTNNPNANTNLQQALILGIPPFMTLTISNAQPTLNLVGSVGAMLMVEGTTNTTSPDYWTTIETVQLTNVAPIAQSNQPQDSLDLAFVPGVQSIPAPAIGATNFAFYRVVMPYDYAILASQVLPPKGYPTRLIVINMPGLVDDACYVTPEASYIHYVWTNQSMQLQPSGSTIRQIANTLAGSLNQNWTTASEFSYSNGMGQILATVVETESPSSDPVAGQNPPGSPIIINF